MTGAPRNGPQASAPQQLSYIKMALDWLCFNITLIRLSSIASNMPGFYIFEVDYPSPTSSQNLGSKGAQYLPIMAKIFNNRPKNHKNPLNIGNCDPESNPGA
jgi:hypothetical protein